MVAIPRSLLLGALGSVAPNIEKRSRTHLHLPTGWAYQNCYKDSESVRLLPVQLYSGGKNTVETCVSRCNSAGYDFAGAEYGVECWCGSSLSSGAQVGTCAKPCSGNSSQTCGDSDMISIYSKFPTYHSYGCFVDQPTRTLSNRSFQSSFMTPKLCQQKCAGYVYAGVEYSTECYCGDSLSAFKRSSECTATCAGDMTKICGGTWAISIYRLVETTTKEVDAARPDGQVAGVTLGTAATGTSAPIAGAVNTVTPAAMAASTPAMGTTGSGSLSAVTSATPPSSSSTSTASLSITPTRAPNFRTQGTGTTSSSTSSSSSSSSSSSTPTSGAPSSASTPSTPSSNASNSTTSNTCSSTPAGSSSGTWWTATGSINDSKPKLVIAHYIVGNSYSHTPVQWTADITLAAAQGIDAFALNMGADTWEPARMQDAYDAASALSSQGITFKMFISFDMTSLSCSNTQAIVTMLQQFANHAAQLMTSTGEMWVSTFAGDACGESMWQTTLNSVGHSYRFIPAFFNDISSSTMKSQFPVIGGDFLWGGGWPSGDTAITWDNDNYRIEQDDLDRASGDIYMTSVSPWFFVHLSSDRNYVYRADDWLYAERWEMLVARRDLVDAVQIVTWNDWGESHYIAPVDPVAADIPVGDYYSTPQYDHTAFLYMTGYYASWYKLGQQPCVTSSKIFMWGRPYSTSLNIPGDSLGPVDNAAWVSDTLFVIVFATGAGQLTITQGASTWTAPVVSGPNKLNHTLVATTSVTAVLKNASQQEVFSFTAPLVYGQASPSGYNFNVITASGPW